jgi:hypothetical protein
VCVCVCVCVCVLTQGLKNTVNLKSFSTCKHMNEYGLQLEKLYAT